jgi:hypothetical protein
MTDENENTPVAVPPEPAAPAAPARVFARTVFRKLPTLTEKQMSKLAPQLRAQYLTEKKHEDDWGHLPPNLSKHLRGMDPKNISDSAVEKHAKTTETDPAHFAAAKAYFKWGIGQEMPLEKYQAAIEEVLSHKHGV